MESAPGTWEVVLLKIVFRSPEHFFGSGVSFSVFIIFFDFLSIGSQHKRQEFVSCSAVFYKGFVQEGGCAREGQRPTHQVFTAMLGNAALT